MKVTKLFCILTLLCAVTMVALPAVCQSITAGDITGVISDPSGAVVPNVSVTAKNDATGETHKTSTNGEGFYRFSLLKPGSYTVTAEAPKFKSVTRRVDVSIGQAANASMALAIEGSSTTIEVTAQALQVDNADLTTEFSNEQIALMPNPGNDLSAVAQSAPGAIMNTQGGFGNFSTYGLPGTSNLFTLNGQNDNDPFLNLNNSGATNLLLGSNDVQQATVVNNGYSGQYGQLAGSQVNYVTKSGGNTWHGNAIYQWNGRAMNANNYLNNLQVAGNPSTPRPFDNANQWALSFGGPISRDKTWFFFNYEGLRVVLPTSGKVKIPDPAFEAAVRANITATMPSSLPFYNQIFSLYNATPGAAGGTPVPCSTFSGSGPCALQVQTTASNFTHEYQMSLRIDHKFSDNDSIFGRMQTDRGVQATSTDRINPIFDTQSTQPEYQGQLSETHIFNQNAVNELKVSGQWYSAIFDNASRKATLQAFPTTLQFVGGDFSRLGGIDFIFPQGRNVTQYQFVDDVSLTRGKHTFKFGVNYHRNDVTDFDYGTFTSGLAVTTVDTFFGGGVDFFQQNFPTRLSQPIALYGLGIYGQDEWRVTPKFKVTLALRLDHNSNPVCQTNCFAELTGPFTSISHDPTVPYNQVIKTGLHQAYPSTDGVVWQPRLGFTWSPLSRNKTVIRGGIGIFSDSFPAVLVDNFSSNPPVLNSFIVAGNLSPAEANNVFSQTSSANTAFSSGFNAGKTFNQLSLIPGFVAPGITASDKTIRQPRYQEWNLEVQQEVGWNTVLSVNYVGNHGIFEAVQNNGLNGFADSTNFPTGFAGLPSAPPDPRFATVNQIQSTAVSNYNGLVTSVKHNFNRGLAFQVNYTWSHALDEISNGGLLPFNDNTNPSPLNPFNPFSLRQNYGNADYDVRHYFSMNYVWSDGLRHLTRWGPKALMAGWTFSGTLFSRSGLPFTVLDGGTAAALNGDNFGGTVAASIVGPTTSGGCGKSNATPNATSGITTSCLNFAGFASPTGLVVNQARNQFRGPKYFDTDFTVMKYTQIRERVSFGIGFQFFNLFNHPNFDQPINDISAGDAATGGAFGTIVSTVNTPTSILGSFLGGDASPRLIQLKAEFKF